MTHSEMEIVYIGAHKLAHLNSFQVKTKSFDFGKQANYYADHISEYSRENLYSYLNKLTRILSSG